MRGHWRRSFNENFYLFILSQKVRHAATKASEWGDKIIRSVFYEYENTDLRFSPVTGGSGLLGCYSMWLGHVFPRFRKTVPPLFSGLWINLRPANRRESVTQPCGATIRSAWLFNTNTGLQLKRYLSGGSFPVVKRQTLLCTSRIFRWSIRSLSLSLCRLLHKWQEGQLLFNIASHTYCVAIDLLLLILCRNDLKCLRFSPRGLIKSAAHTLCVLDEPDPFQIGVFGQEHFHWKQVHLITIMP